MAKESHRRHCDQCYDNLLQHEQLCYRFVLVEGPHAVSPHAVSPHAPNMCITGDVILSSIYTVSRMKRLMNAVQYNMILGRHPITEMISYQIDNAAIFDNRVQQ